MTIENEELNEDSLFEQAVGDDPVTPEPPPEPEPTPEPKAELTPEPEKPVVDDNAPLVPSWRLREINEEKRVLSERVKALEAERLAPPQAEPPKAEKAAKPDPLLEPEAYEKYIEAKVEDRLLHDRRENSMAAAHAKHGVEFEEAMTSAMRKIDPALQARMQSAHNPGETLIQWHREEKAKAEVGTDLSAYKQRLREEALKDPEFRKAAMEAWRADAAPLVNGRPRVELPPSLSGASRSNAALRSSNDDVSDDALWEQTTA